MWPQAYLALKLPPKQTNKKMKQIFFFPHEVALREGRSFCSFCRGTQIRNEQNYLAYQLIHSESKVNLLLFSGCISHSA